MTFFEGPAGVEKFFTGLFANGVTGHKLELIEVDRDDDWTRCWAPRPNGRRRARTRAGAPATFSGVATHVFESSPMAA